ncbi:MAG: diadenylate cyclase CdaA [Verrucomicrobiota bacterium]
MPESTIIEFFQERWRNGVEILILAVIVYFAYKYFRATRGARIFIGLLVSFIALSLLSQALNLEVLDWIIKSFSVFLAIAMVVIFQPELRRALAELGSHRLFSPFSQQKGELLEELNDAVQQLSSKRYGALIAIERGIALKQYLETGVELDALFAPETALAIFHPKGALHDGGTIIQQDRIAAAGCVFPVSQKELSDRSIGLRHRAGIGITDESDAIAVIVSEETGHISLAHNGKLERDVPRDQFKKRLQEFLFLKVDDEEKSADERSDSPQLESETRKPAAGVRDLVSD